MINRNIKTLCIGLIFAASILLLTVTEAHAIRVSLKRIVFEGSKKSEVLTIINNSGEDQTYRLGWRKYRMDEKKSLRAITEGEKTDDILWAEDMIRYAPRRIKVPAGASQQIRLLLRRPANLEEAEYRAHLWIVTESKPEEFDVTAEQLDRQSIKLAVQPAISLPVFVRNGKLSAQANITNAKLSKIPNGLKTDFTLNRTGSSSIYGDFDLICTDMAQNKVLKQVRGVSVYPEIDKRYMSFNIDLSAEKVRSCNNVDIVYRADPDDPVHKGKALAKASVSLK